MLKTELLHGDEIEVSVESKEWKPAKTLFMHKDPFMKNIIQVTVIADVIVKPEDTKGYLGVFINDENKPRAVLESDLPYSYPQKVQFDTYNVPFGKNKLTICLKSDQGYPVTNTFLEIYTTRFYNIYEMAGVIIPIEILGGS